MAPDVLLLDEAHAAFIQSGVSVAAASRNAHNVPTLARAIACRVASDRRRVTIFLPRLQSSALLADVAANRFIAVVFSQPSTHRTIQLKSVDAVLTPLAPGDAERIAEHAELVIADIKRLGFGDALLRAFFGYTDAEISAIAFTPSAAFTQTPGPGAGARLGS
jgi:hypothetical protein